MRPADRPTFSDYLLVGLFAVVLFGFAGFSGRPLTMHEARLPETSREMNRRGDWLLPTSGGRPWLERPPLPHWVVIWAMKLTGRDDRVWVVRLPSAVMGVATVLLTVWTAGRLFGRAVGVAAGLMLATSYEFYVYACQAEDDNYLAAVVAAGVALFVRAHLLSAEPKSSGRFSFATGRSVAVVGFFIVLGLTNLTKGPLLGIVFFLGGPVGVFLVYQSIVRRSLQPLLRFTWLWGWLIMIVLTVAWPAWAYHKYPDVLDNLKYDYVGRMNHDYSALNEPWYYYVHQLPTAVSPWTVVMVVAVVWRTIEYLKSPAESWSDQPLSPFPGTPGEGGGGGEFSGTFVTPTGPHPSPPPGYRDRGPEGAATTTRDHAGSEIGNGSRPRLLPPAGDFRFWFVAVAALFPVLLLSVPSGKHHHYLVPCLAPWAILSAVAGVRVGRRVPGRVFVAAVVVLGIAYSFVQARYAGGTDHTIDDTAFLARVRSEVPAAVPLYIDAKMGPPGNLDFFRTQFYSRSSAILIHNLSYLRDETISDPVVYVICRTKDEPVLARFGTVRKIDQSEKSHEERDDKTGVVFGRFTLYRLTFDPALRRYPAPAGVTSLQAMERAPGPWCGPAVK